VSRRAWQFVLGLLIGLLVALAAGWIAGYPALLVAAYLAVVVAMQAWNLIRFERWLRLRSILKPPNMRGLWGDVLERANRLYQRKRYHKRRALTLLRELRRMTSAMPDGTISSTSRAVARARGRGCTCPTSAIAGSPSTS